jgi:hypothetical protein
MFTRSPPAVFAHAVEDEGRIHVFGTFDWVGFIPATVT